VPQLPGCPGDKGPHVYTLSVTSYTRGPWNPNGGYGYPKITAKLAHRAISDEGDIDQLVFIAGPFLPAHEPMDERRCNEAVAIALRSNMYAIGPSWRSATVSPGLMV
jgi:hypothetical protein